MPKHLSNVNASLSATLADILASRDKCRERKQDDEERDRRTGDGASELGKILILSSGLGGGIGYADPADGGEPGTPSFGGD